MPCTTLAGKDADHAPLIARQDYGNAFNPSPSGNLPQDQPRHYASKTTICDLPKPLRYTSTDVDSSAGVLRRGISQRGNDGDRIIDQLAYQARPLNQESGIGEEDFVTLVLPFASAREG